MPVVERDSETYEFGTFRLEVTERRLLRAGEPVSLTPKAFELLLMLVRNDGKLLRKQELMEQVWPGTVVEEANLMNNIAFLRKVLGTTPQDRSFIETVPRQGYRFQGNVNLIRQTPATAPPAPMVIERFTVTEVITTEIETSTFTEPAEPIIDITADQPVNAVRSPQSPALLENPQPPNPSSQSAALSPQSPVPIFSVMAVSLLAVFGFGWMYFNSNRSPAKTNLPPVRLRPLTALEGEEKYPAFSPDGQQVAFAWDKSGLGNLDIYLMQVGGANPKQITDGPLPELRPVWSPDGKSLAFLRQHDTTTELIVRTLETGTERSWGLVGDGMDWSPDGKRMVIQEANPTTGSHLALLDLETGNRTLLTQPGEPFSDIRPMYSPNGKEIAFFRIKNSDGNLFVISAQGGNPEQLTFDNQQVENLAWLAPTNELIYSSSRSGIMSLWRLPRTGGESQPVPYVTGHCDNLAIDRSGTRLVFRQRNSDTNIWKMDLPQPGKPANLAPGPIVLSSFMDDSPDFSPDGQRMVFSSNRTGTWEIWMCRTSGSDPVRLSFFNKGIAGSPRWSPDGSTIVFDWGFEGEKYLYSVKLEGSAPQPLTDRSSWNFLPSWSPDGQWIYFCSNRSGSQQIWKMPVAGGEAVQVTQQGGWEAQAAPDGKHLYYMLARQTPGIFQLDVATGETRPVPELAEAGKIRYWCVTATGIYFAVAANGTNWEIRFFDFQSRQVQTLFSLPRPPARSQRGLDVLPNQKTVVFVVDDRYGSDLMLAENFR
ncbi:MAG: winged helix-turn-helix domain-containing protein [Blastocatellia bacterium]|nr:winged helix-turn-helix domain-containing protein [Blastocatellia bacterium]